MTYPTRPSRSYSYTGFAQAQGNNVFPGTNVDSDFDVLENSVNQLIDFIQILCQPDGTLNNGRVTKAALDASILLGLKAPTAWAPGVTYAVNDTITTNSQLYIAKAAHVSGGTFAPDLAAGNWSKIADFQASSTPGDGTVTTSKIVANAVTNALLASASVDGRVLAPASVSASHLNNLGTVPVGVSMEFEGVNVPSGWLLKYGQAISRTTYSALFNVLSSATQGTTTVNSASVTGLPTDLRGIGFMGAYVEGVGIPAGTTISAMTATGLTLSNNATASGAVTLRFFPHGNGDGSTTFNLPDDRGYVAAGRTDMGYVDSGVLPSGITGAGVGRAGGEASHTLTNGEMPIHNHLGVTTNDSPDHTHPTNNQDIIASITLGGGSTIKAAGTTNNTGGASARHTHGIPNDGGGLAHNNVQPTRIKNKIIFTGVYS